MVETSRRHSDTSTTWRQVKDLSKQLKPVAVALDRLQGDKVSIADACDTWLNLLSDDSLSCLLYALITRDGYKFFSFLHFFV